MELKRLNKMAQMAEIAYADPVTAKKEYKKLGYTGYKYFDVDGAQAHAVWKKYEYCICFRGTEPSEISDVLADLNAIPRGSMTHGLVHSGFRKELDKLWGQLVDHQSVYLGKNFYITGHSLGAAMATIATSRFEEFTEVTELYTFGSPRAGTRKFVNAIKTPHFRCVNNNDIVTRVPLAFMGYKHHGKLVYINFYGNIRNMTSWQRIKDRFRGVRAAWRKGVVFDGAYDHGMNYYVNYTKENKNV